MIHGHVCSTICTRFYETFLRATQARHISSDTAHDIADSKGQSTMKWHREHLEQNGGRREKVRIAWHGLPCTHQTDLTSVVVQEAVTNPHASSDHLWDLYHHLHTKTKASPTTKLLNRFAWNDSASVHSSANAPKHFWGPTWISLARTRWEQNLKSTAANPEHLRSTEGQEGTEHQWAQTSWHEMRPESVGCHSES